MLTQAQAQNASDKDITVADPLDQPTDTVSCISWAPNGTNPIFATSSWDSWMRLYSVDLETSALVQKSCFDAESPCLSVAWHHDETTVFAGCSDGSVKSLDVATGASNVIGYHEGPVQSVHWLAEPNALLTLSFDKTLRFWDPRQAKHVAGFQLLYKPFCSDVMYPYLAVGMSEAKMLVMDLNQVQSTLGRGSEAYLKSPLGKTQPAFIKFFPGENIGVGMGDNYGRCNLSHLEDNLGPQSFRVNSIMTFKVHDIKKTKSAGIKEGRPISSIGFHPDHKCNFLYTAGGDGKMRFWDTQYKGDVVNFNFKGIPVTRAEMDPTGKFLAYALGYDWARGIGGYMSHPSKVCVHVMQDRELARPPRGHPNDEVYPLKYE